MKRAIQRSYEPFMHGSAKHTHLFVESCARLVEPHCIPCYQGHVILSMHYPSIQNLVLYPYTSHIYLKLLNACIHSFMKLSSHGTKIHSRRPLLLVLLEQGISCSHGRREDRKVCKFFWINLPCEDLLVRQISHRCPSCYDDDIYRHT